MSLIICYPVRKVSLDTKVLPRKRS